MSANNRNRLKTTVSAVASSGLGAFTISTASSGRRSFVAGDDGLTFDGVLITEGTAWEVRDGCVYTHSGTSLSRGTLMDSSTGSAIAFTSAAVLSQGGTADFARRAESAGLRTSISSADANLTMQVGVLHCVDISGYTADRTATLPAVAAVDDRVGLYISAGDDALELIYTAASGDTLGGVAGGTEKSRLFITAELVIFRCVVANTTWIVEYDGRIPQEGLMDLTTASDGEAASTYVRPTQTGTAGVWTSRIDVGGVVSTANDYMLVRRAGKYKVSLGYAPKDTGTVGAAVNARIILNDTQEECGPSATCTGWAINRCAASKLISMAAGDYVRYQYRTTDGSIGCAAFRGSFLSIMEVLR